MKSSESSKRIFLSHGRNPIVRFKLKEFVRDRLKMTPVILQDEPDLGMTIVEKLEHYGSDCFFALIVLTSDDFTTEGGKRARQNVIHELGFFHGKLGRRRVLLLRQAEVELFSNISGLIYKEFTGDSVESVFEDIRMAVESGDAVAHGQEVPKETEGDRIVGVVSAVADGFKRFDTEVAPSWARDILNELNVYQDLSPEQQIKHFKPVLQNNLRKWQRSLEETERSIEHSKNKKDDESDKTGFGALMNLGMIMLVGPTKKTIAAIQRALVKIQAFDTSGGSISSDATVKSVLECFLSEDESHR